MYIIIILPLLLYEWETWSFILREKRSLRLFENKVLRGIFGPKRDEVTGEKRKLHKGKFNKPYCTPSIVRARNSRRMGWTGLVARMGKRRVVYESFGGDI
jgi:hypothetical protein